MAVNFKVWKVKSKMKLPTNLNFDITWNWPFYQTHLMICRHIFKVFSVLQVKSVQYFDYVPYWREDASKKKIKRDKKRFWASVVTFRHEKRLQSFIEFIGKKTNKSGTQYTNQSNNKQGTKVGQSEDQSKINKEMRQKYIENKNRVRQEFGLRKKVEMYVEQAQREVKDYQEQKENKTKRKKQKDLFDMSDIQKHYQKKKEAEKQQSSSSSDSDSSESSNSSSSDSESETSDQEDSNSKTRSKKSSKKSKQKSKKKTRKRDLKRMRKKNNLSEGTSD